MVGVKGIKKEFTDYFSKEQTKKRMKARQPRKAKKTKFAKGVGNVRQEVASVRAMHPFGVSESMVRHGVKAKPAKKVRKKKKKKMRGRKVVKSMKTKKGTTTVTTYY